MDRAAYLESLRVLIEQAPDFTFFFAKPQVEGNVAITPVPFFGTTPEGSHYEWSYVQVAVADPDTGTAVAFEFFDDDQWDDAVARFEELGRASRSAAHVLRRAPAGSDQRGRSGCSYASASSPGRTSTPRSMSSRLMRPGRPGRPVRWSAHQRSVVTGGATSLRRSSTRTTQCGSIRARFGGTGSRWCATSSRPEVS